METRREFLRQATVTLVLTPIAAVACGSSTSVSPVTAPIDAGANVCAVNATSSVVGGHSHTVCVDAATVANPPAQGMTFTTSVSAGHTHTVSLTQAELETIRGGGEVTVMTSITLSHQHQFMLVRMAAAAIIDSGILDGSHLSSSSSSSGGGPSGTPTPTPTPTPGGSSSGGRGY
jgi:hypothetical protein